MTTNMATTLPRYTSRIENPLRDLISDETFQQLQEQGLLDEKGLRDYLIRTEFRALRKTGWGASDAIEKLREQYPYLQFDTLRKIVYALR